MSVEKSNFNILDKSTFPGIYPKWVLLLAFAAPPATWAKFGIFGPGTKDPAG